MKHLRPTPLVLALLVAALLAGAGLRAADKTPAGTIIRNNAAITYQTLDDRDGSATSNEVVMVVTPVYGLEILPDGTPAGPGQTLRATAGQTVYLPYTLRFTGNEEDNATLETVWDAAGSTFRPELDDGSGFTGFTVYHDLDSSGTVNAGDVLAASWKDGDDDGQIDAGELAQNALGQTYEPDGLANLIVVFKVPAGTPNGRLANVGVNGRSVNSAAADLGGNYSRVAVVDEASLRPTKSASASSVAPGTAVTFSLGLSNDGTQAAERRSYTVDADTYEGVLLYDVLPTNAAGDVLAFTGTPAGTHSGGTSTIIYSTTANPSGDPQAWTWTASKPAVPTAIAVITSDGTTHQDLAASGTMTLTFQLTPGEDDSGQTFTNTAYANRKDGGTYRTVPSNPVQFSVTGIIAVNLQDTDATSDDHMYQAAQAGQPVYFRNRVQNKDLVGGKGTIEETYNLTVAGVPAGWTVQLFQSDGVTPLRDTGDDGIPDTGPIAPEGFRDIYVQVRTPDDEVLATDTPLTVTATAVSDPRVSDPTTDHVTSVTGLSFTLANSNPVGTQDFGSITKTGATGAWVDFPLLLRNTAAGGRSDTYRLSATFTGDDVAAWRVQFYVDADQDGVVDDNELQPVGQSLPVAPQQFGWLVARVFVPAGAAYDAVAGGGQDNYGVTFAAQSTLKPALTSQIADAVQLDPYDNFELEPDRSGIVAPGSVIFHRHLLRNTGERANRYYLERTSQQAKWAFALLDGAGDPLPTDAGAGGKPYVDLVAGAQAAIQLRIFVPVDTPLNTTDLSVITASARDYLPGVLREVVDATTVIKGDLVLAKAADKTTAKPGDEITYTTTYTNRGDEPLTNVNIYDQVPAYTEYVGAIVVTAPAGTNVTKQESKDGGLNWVGSPAAPSADVTNMRVILDTLPAGGTGTVTFKVKVK